MDSEFNQLEVTSGLTAVMTVRTVKGFLGTRSTNVVLLHKSLTMSKIIISRFGLLVDFFSHQMDSRELCEQ